MLKLVKFSPLVALTLLPTSHAFSQQQYQDFAFVGISGELGKSVFTDSSKAKASVQPNLFYNGEYGFIDGSLANVTLFPYVGLSGHWRFAEVSDDFDDIPNGIKDRDGNGELGITLGTVGARVTFLQDVTNQHNGYEVQLHLGRTFDVIDNYFTITPYVEVDYRSRELSQHLYDISFQESTASGLEQFESSHTWVYQGGLIGLVDVNTNWSALGKLELQHHDSDSPLIQRDLGWSFSLGAVYKF